MTGNTMQHRTTSLWEVVYPGARYLSPKVKTFVDHLQARTTPPPWEVGPMP